MRQALIVFFAAVQTYAATQACYIGYKAAYSFLSDVDGYLEREEDYLRSRGIEKDLDAPCFTSGVDIRYLFIPFEHLGALVTLSVEGSGRSYDIADSALLVQYLHTLFGYQSDERYLDGDFHISLQASSVSLCVFYEFALGQRANVAPYAGLGLNVATFDEHYWWPSDTRFDYNGEAVLVSRNAYRLGPVAGVMSQIHLFGFIYLSASAYYRFGMVHSDEWYGHTFIEPFGDIDLSGVNVTVGVGARFGRR